MSANPSPHPYAPQDPAGATRERFSLYAAGGRLYAQDRRALLVELGTLERRDDGFAYRVDGDARLCGSRFAGADDVLHDLARRLDSGFLGSRFATLPDRAEDYTIDLNGAAHFAVELDTGYGAAPSLQGVGAARAAPGTLRLAR